MHSFSRSEAALPLQVCPSSALARLYALLALHIRKHEADAARGQSMVYAWSRVATRPSWSMISTGADQHRAPWEVPAAPSAPKSAACRQCGTCTLYSWLLVRRIVRHGRTSRGRILRAVFSTRNDHLDARLCGTRDVFAPAAGGPRARPLLVWIKQQQGDNLTMRGLIKPGRKKNRRLRRAPRRRLKIRACLQAT